VTPLNRAFAIAYLAMFFVLLAFGCGTGPQPVPTPPPDAASPYSCVTVCQRGAAMGCSWVEMTPNGASCADVCNNALAFGLPWDLVCRSTAATCAAVSQCQ
jgi:hypothetical protein